MAEKEAKGRIWFKGTVCKNCTNSDYCLEYGTEELLECIDAEKLRLMLELRDGDCLAIAKR